MNRRRVPKLSVIVNWRTIGITMCAAITFIVSALQVPAMAEPQPSEQLPNEFLDACDAQAKAFGSYDSVIAKAVNALVAMGVFTETEFHPVTIGFCDLRLVDGPVATTSCARNAILLDSGYAARDQELVVNATLAHEMKHHLQHGVQKTKFGDGYCSSAQYDTDKTWMEEEADAFGDAVGALFFVGRPVEIINECAVPVSVYLEADNPISTSSDAATFTNIPAGSTIVSTERAISKFFKLYAETKTNADHKKTWGNARMAHQRRIDGNIYGLKNVALNNPSRSIGPFQMTLTCND